MFTTLIEVSELQQLLATDNLLIVDCRFSLADKEEGRRAYQAAHIPTAIYAHLDEDLSGEIIAGTTGRHPLPKVADFTKQLSDWGVDDSVQVVVYDDKGGAIASRLWWMLQWLGHQQVAVLNGSVQAWERAGLELTNAESALTPRTFVAQEQSSLVVDATFVETSIGNDTICILDARAAARYRGENEPIDPIAGHIPTALSAPFMENWDSEKMFLSKEVIKARFEEIVGDNKPESCVVYCGSGVTACHNILAIQHAGLGKARLYPGSWSDWITDDSRRIVTA